MVLDVKAGEGPDALLLTRLSEGFDSHVGDGSLAIDEVGRFLGVVTRGKKVGLSGNLVSFQMLPATVLQDSVRAVLSRGTSVKAGWLGIMVDEGTEKVRVEEVISDSPASAAGLRVGDIIVGIGARPVESKESFIQSLRWSGAGSRVQLTVEREGMKARLYPELAERPVVREAFAWAVEIPKVWDQKGASKETSVRLYPLRLPPKINLGLTVDAVTPQLAQYFKLPKLHGLLIKSVLENSMGRKAGFRAGDVLLEINDVSLDSASDLKEVIQKASDGNLLIRFCRDGVVVEKELLLQ
jgi:serine protease Do